MSRKNKLPRRKQMAKTKSKKQVGKLLSRNSPLSSIQKTRLKRELSSGKVKIRG